MEITIIEKTNLWTDDAKVSEFCQANKYALYEQNRSAENGLDNKQVCELLKISLRTL